MPATARAAPRASPRASRRRRPASSSFRARPRSGRSSRRFLGGARQLRRAAGGVHAAGGNASSARHRIGRIALSLTHDRGSASAVALAQPTPTRDSARRQAALHLLPLRRRVILANLRRVFGDDGSDAPRSCVSRRRTTAHLWRLAGEFFRFRWLSRERKARAGARREPRRASSPRSRRARASSC